MTDKGRLEKSMGEKKSHILRECKLTIPREEVEGMFSEEIKELTLRIAILEKENVAIKNALRRGNLLFY